MNQQVQVTAPDLVLANQSLFDNAAPDGKLAWSKESQFAIQLLSNNDYLMGAAVKNQASLQNAIINVAAIGISLNPALKHAYLVPRSMGKNKPVMVCLDVSYQGLMHLAMQAGLIEWGQAKLVYQNDDYQNTGIDSAPIHKQNTFGDKGPVVGVYCTVKLKSGDYLTEEMDVEAIRKVQNTSKAKTGPWTTWWDEMARKTVVKRAYKYWPKAESVSQAIEVINQHEGLDFDNMKEVSEPQRTASHAYAANIESIKAIREAFEEERFADVVMYWDEISSEEVGGGKSEQELLWVAPSKYEQYGLPEPVFSTALRKFLKEESSQYR